MEQDHSQVKRKEMPNARELEILWHLYRDPRKKDIPIANETGINESQVRYAREAMIQRGWIKVNPRVDLSTLGFPERYRVDIWIDQRQLKGKMGGMPQDETKIENQREMALYLINKVAKRAEFKSNILIEDILILLGGPADLTVIVRATTNDAMLDFVTEGLRMCGGIEKTATCLEQRSYLTGTL
jgi:DNA-binding Lrp family transcriptional regulator